MRRSFGGNGDLQSSSGGALSAADRGDAIHMVLHNPNESDYTPDAIQPTSQLAAASQRLGATTRLDSCPSWGEPSTG